MKNGTDSKKQLNVRVSSKLRQKFDQEIARQGRKRDFVAERVIEHWLKLPPDTREDICIKAA